MGTLRVGIVALVLGVVLASCETPPPLGSLDGGPQALICATPISQPLVRPTTGSIAGVPMAVVTWNAGHCGLANDERAPGLVVIVADFTGTFLAAPSVVAGNRWQFDSTSAGTLSSSVVSNIPRDTDITLRLTGNGERITITLRMSASALVLTDMHRI